ncbi:MAG: hypothetical protein L0332_24230 [Chloroflexi bacterium]|nr:hypothetical protein [Chloroflexota bacterium]MCI0648598.1 hypothetical protein [Chloroflexota bacterium]MCI0729803.1 hypothetical protein [Chloroflexota bacterium]
MSIPGTENLTPAELHQQLQAGGKFVVFSYAISLVVITFKRDSGVYFIRPGQSAFLKGIQYTLLTLLLGWWGIPFGPIFSIWALVVNLGGGRDVTAQVTGRPRATT